MRGPGAALGAVIWSHGKNRSVDRSHAPIDLYAAALRDAGWDVFRLNRALPSDNLDESPRALGNAVDRLHGEDYHRIVLAGQSYGAWISIALAGRRDDIHAVIATAPAAYGTWHSEDAGRAGQTQFYRNASEFYDRLGEVRSARTMLFFFKQDDFDPGGRGERSVRILRDRHVPSMVVDQPPDFVGHGSAHGGLFYRRYAACIVAFVDPAADPGKTACDTSWGTRPSNELPHPGDLKPLPDAATVPPPTMRFRGYWWGWFPNGREVAVVTERLAESVATIAYIVGPGVTPDLKPGVSRRTGRLDADVLTFSENGRPSLTLRPRQDGRLNLRWEAADRSSTLDAVLTRME